MTAGQTTVDPFAAFTAPARPAPTQERPAQERPAQERPAQAEERPTQDRAAERNTERSASTQERQRGRGRRDSRSAASNTPEVAATVPVQADGDSRQIVDLTEQTPVTSADDQGDSSTSGNDTETSQVAAQAVSTDTSHSTDTTDLRTDTNTDTDTQETLSMSTATLDSAPVETETAVTSDRPAAAPTNAASTSDRTKAATSPSTGEKVLVVIDNGVIKYADTEVFVVDLGEMTSDTTDSDTLYDTLKALRDVKPSDGRKRLGDRLTDTMRERLAL